MLEHGYKLNSTNILAGRWAGAVIDASYPTAHHSRRVACRELISSFGMGSADSACFPPHSNLGAAFGNLHTGRSYATCPDKMKSETHDDPQPSEDKNASPTRLTFAFVLAFVLHFLARLEQSAAMRGLLDVDCLTSMAVGAICRNAWIADCVAGGIAFKICT